LNHKPDNPPGLSYRDAGVDIDAGNALVDRIRPAVKSTNREGVVTGLGGFGGLFRLDAGKYEDPILVSGTDGVGTKLLLARQLRRHDTIGTDLVAMCVNDILTCGAEPLFFLDYYATGKLELDEAQAVIEGIADGCRQAGCALIGGETAEMPGMYGIGEYDLAGFAVGAVDRPKLIDGSAVAEGHVVLGLASSGPHSNGYSLIRKVLETSACDPATPLGEATLGEVLLAPTRIYVKALLPLLEHHSIDGLAHITGGGLDENVIRIVPDGLGLEIDLAAWQWPAVFDWLQTSGHIGENEMLRTFNCGIGMAILVPADEAGPVTNALEAAGEAVYRIGRVIATNDEQRVRFIRS
jgi:phosphoribosylformylglycinamidine cyclo-ligase